jgi:Domain of unknown function (DUF1835)
VPALHVTNGDCAAGLLRSFLIDPVLVTCDVLHDGPAPLVDGDAWYDTRARFLTDAFEARYDETRAALAAFDRQLSATNRYDETVLWFEHDLFDQLLLVRTLDVVARGRPDATDVSLICIGEFPGVNRFVGLGQLTADELASLYPRRARVTPNQLALAREAWRAFRREDPTELRALMQRLNGDGALPFLRDAIRRLFEEYPWTTNGLSRTAAATLRALQAAPVDAGDLFRASQSTEARPFLGDLGFFDIVRALAGGRTPLVTVSPAGASQDLRGHRVALTDAGRNVLEDRADAVALNGIDEWRGGVHLAGADRSPWRWDPQRETLVS